MKIRYLYTVYKTLDKVDIPAIPIYEPYRGSNDTPSPSQPAPCRANTRLITINELNKPDP